MDKEALWSVLLDLIEGGTVVPIVGPGLLTVTGAEGEFQYYSQLSTRLAKEVNVEHEPGSPPDLNTIACLYMKEGGRLEDLYSIVQRVAEDGTLPLPRALQKLARIQNFRLFVATTFDSLLVRALNEARPDRIPRVLSFSLSRPQDLSSTFSSETGSSVYHLFGKFSSRAGDYALTQEDILEFMYSMQSEKRPANLYKELADNSLLILGNSFSGWRARFFLRLIRKGRLAVATKPPSFVAEPEIAMDKGMTVFVENFSRDTRIFPSAGPVEFVDELYRRWTELHPDPRETPTAPNSKADSEPYIFISYPDEDRGSAEKISRALDAKGINSFYDRDRDGSGLQGGDNCDIKLHKKIRNCSLFMPIVSRHVQTPGDRYFRREWNAAIDQLRGLPAWYSSSSYFLLPVAIDSTSLRNTDSVPPEFNKPYWFELPDGLPTADFVTRVQQVYRGSQQAKVGGR